MPNTKILKENGQEFYPVTHASLIVGMENQGRMDATYAWDGTGTPDIAKIPAGVVVTYDGTNYTGTLAASADTAGRFYLVPSTTVTGEYDRYLTDATGSTITWKPAGTTAIPTPSILDNVTSTDTDKALSANQGKLLKDDLSQLEAKVDELAGETGIAVGYSLVANEYVSASDGSFLSYNGWSRTDYIDISAYSSIKIEGTATGYNYFYAADKSPVSSLNLALTGSTLDLSNYPTAKYLVLSDSSANMANLSITVLGYRGDTIVSLGTRVSALETDSNNFSSLPQDGLAFVKRIKSVGESGYITIPFDIPIVLPKGMALKLKVSGVTVNSGTIAAYFKDSNNQYYSANSTGADIERTFTFNEDKTIVEYGINKDAPSVVFSAEVVFVAGYIADLDGVESELSGISQQVETNTDNISELQEETIGVTNNHNASELTSTNYYSLSDGTLQGQSASYASGEFNLSANIAKITASFPASNWSFGILLYDESDNFIASYHADTSIEINLAGLGAAKAIIQNYSGWDETVFAFVGENHISSLETDVETIKGKVSPEYTTIVATRNVADYNSIREIIASITDATPSHKYIVFVPVGRWFECDIQGKENVSIVGEDRERTILYCDGTSSNLTPDGYSYPAVGSGVALSSVNQQYKHCIFAKNDIDISNLTIEVNDAKYCVHLDNPNWSNVVIKNCHLTAKANTNYAVGVGINGGQKIDIQNTVIERTTSEGGVFLHNWNNQSAPSSINIDKCYFKGCDFGTIDELGSEQDDEWLITNCYSSKATPSIRWMVDHDGDGNTYWVNPETGEREPNPQAVPYCIKLNTLGSNVKSVVKAGYNGTSVIARPNCLDYMISNFDIIQDEE